MSKRLQLGLAVSVLLLLSGCEPIDRVDYVLQDEQGVATLKLGEHVEVRFSDRSLGDARATGELQIGGPGGERGNIQVGELVVDHQYDYNHLTFTVGETTVELTQNGNQLAVGDQTYDLSEIGEDNRLVLLVDESGNVTQEAN